MVSDVNLHPYNTEEDGRGAGAKLPSGADASTRSKFCTFSTQHLEDKGTVEDFGMFLRECPEKKTFDYAAASAEGNQLLRVSYTLAVGFDATWQFRMEVHAFRGAIVIRRRGQHAPVASVPARLRNKRLGLSVAFVNARLAAGVYTIEGYGAYDAAGYERATSAGAKNNDAILFRQPGYCGVQRWTLLQAGELDKCGGG